MEKPAAAGRKLMTQSMGAVGTVMAFGDSYQLDKPLAPGVALASDLNARF